MWTLSSMLKLKHILSYQLKVRSRNRYVQLRNMQYARGEIDPRIAVPKS